MATLPSRTSAPPRPNPNLTSLPPEILEEIIIVSAFFGAPATVAAVARTCRSFRAHVYHSYHKHLWRQLYLVLFDHPRPARAFASYGRSPVSDGPSSPTPDDFPWESEYKRRIWTANYFRRRTEPAIPPEAQPPSSAEELYAALDTLLAVLRTATALDPPTLDHLPLSLSDHPHPVFPPFALVTHLQPSRIHPSRSIRWLSAVLAHGYPHVLARRLSYPAIDLHTPAEPYDPLLSQLLAFTGLRQPLNSPRGHRTNDGEGENSHDADHEAPSSSASSQLTAEEDDPLPEGQEMLSRPEQDGVRRLARVRVYNMAYLKRERMHGPFLPIQPPSSQSQSPRSPSLLIPRGTENSIFVSTLDESDDGDDDASDEDYVDPHASDSGSDSSDGEQDPSLQPSQSHGYTDQPSPDSIRFDWAWLGAARLVVEKNLRDLLMGRHHHILRALMSLDALRPGSAPGFNNERILGRPPSEGEEEEDNAEAKEEEGHWDWAGVEGQWRRCVCWMDYRDLVRNNVLTLKSRFDDPQLYEVMRIVPITMRVVRYERSGWPGRPTIYVKGELSGTENEVRVWGKVEMVGEGDVRWSLFSSREGGDGTWVSEGVQLGGLGSATGVLGMWTGAEHEHMDPIGPFWAWKVGPLPSAHARTLPAKQTVKEAVEEWDRLAERLGAGSERLDRTEAF